MELDTYASRDGDSNFVYLLMPDSLVIRQRSGSRSFVDVIPLRECDEEPHRGIKAYQIRYPRQFRLWVASVLGGSALLFAAIQALVVFAIPLPHGRPASELLPFFASLLVLEAAVLFGLSHYIVEQRPQPYAAFTGRIDGRPIFTVVTAPDGAAESFEGFVAAVRAEIRRGKDDGSPKPAEAGDAPIRTARFADGFWTWACSLFRDRLIMTGEGGIERQHWRFEFKHCDDDRPTRGHEESFTFPRQMWLAWLALGLPLAGSFLLLTYVIDVILSWGQGAVAITSGLGALVFLVLSCVVVYRFRIRHVHIYAIFRRRDGGEPYFTLRCSESASYPAFENFVSAVGVAVLAYRHPERSSPNVSPDRTNFQQPGRPRIEDGPP